MELQHANQPEKDSEQRGIFIQYLNFFIPESLIFQAIKRKGAKYFLLILGGAFKDIGRFISRILGGRTSDYSLNQIPKYNPKDQNTMQQQLNQAFGKPEGTINHKQLKKALAELDNIIGLKPVKEFVVELQDMVQLQRERKKAGQSISKQSLHMIFTGNPGTGKTTVARIVAQVFKTLGVVTKGHLVEVTREDLVGEYIGHTAPKTRKIIESAVGGVLFIDEAYALSRGGQNDFGKEAIDTLVKCMEEYRHDLIVILAGYSKEMDDFLKANSGLKSRFANIVEFPDYTPKELLNIAQGQLGKEKFIVDDQTLKALYSILERRQVPGRNDDGNGRLVRKVIEEAVRKQSKRLRQKGYQSPEELRRLLPEDFGFIQEELFDLEHELQQIVGNMEIKEHIKSLSAQVLIQKMRRDKGLIDASNGQSLHMVFKGNPGTGKTTVARIIGRMLKEMGVLKSGQLIETDRSGLVASYVGQTAEKTNDRIKEALGGILFIDEAYALASGGENDFGKEAIDTLVKGMEDHRENLIVILAGYNDDMDHFFQVNAGLRSRFPNVFEFKDYTVDELLQILRMMAEKSHFFLAPGCENAVRPILQKAAGHKESGNGRYVRNLFEQALRNQAIRLQGFRDPSENDLMTLLPEDFSKEGK